jgi:hypothetical protein
MRVSKGGSASEAEMLKRVKTAAAPKGISLGLAFFLGCILAALVVAFHVESPRLDFGVFYYAAHMVLDGARHELYSVSAQHAFQMRFHRPPTQLFVYLPPALIPYMPLALLPMPAAYVVWAIVSLGLLVLSVRVLAAEAGVHQGDWPVLLSLAFMPVFSCLAHGQISILVLTVYVAVYVLWKNDRPFLGGAVLAIVLIKLQLVAGFAAVLLLRRKWRELGGFAAGAAAMLCVSALMTGFQGLLAYPVLLRQLTDPASRLRHDALAITSEPHNMANWRGLVDLTMGPHHVPLVLGLSLLTLVWAAWTWRDLETGFSAALLATMLTSFHFHPQDLTLCLAPMFLSRTSGLLPAPMFFYVAIAGLAAAAVIAAFALPFALFAIPLAAGLAAMSLRRARFSAEAAAGV